MGSFVINERMSWVSGNEGRKRMSSLLPLFVLSLLSPFLVLSCRPSIEKREEKLSLALQRSLSQTSELGVVQYKLRKVVKADDSQWFTIGDRKILYSCAAYIKAGVDLREFSSRDVEITPEGTALITLPHARILSVDIPSDEVVLAYEQVGILRSPFTAQERNAILQEGERQIREDIPSLGIVGSAEAQASKFFEILLRDMGYEDVVVSFRDSKMREDGR